MSSVNSFIRALKRLDRFELGCIVLCFFAIVVYFVTFDYCDGQAFLAWSYEFWDALIDGKPFSFPNVVIDNLRNSEFTTAADPIYMLPEAVWNFPFWLISVLFQIQDITGGVFYIWNKLLYVVLFIGIVAKMTEISELLSEDVHCGLGRMIIIMLGSAEMIYCMTTGQDEFIYYFFFMQSVVYFLKGNKIGFYICSMAAVYLCTLMLIPYLCIVLFTDKDCVSILSKVAIVLVPSKITALVYSGSIYVRYNDVSNVNYLSWFFGTGLLNTGWGSVSILFLILLFVFIYCFYHPCIFINNSADKKDLFFCLALSLTALEFIGWDQFYRAFLWLPMMTLYIVNFRKDNDSLSILCCLEMIRTLVISVAVKCGMFATVFVADPVKKLFGNHLNDIGIWGFPDISSETLNILLVSSEIGVVFFLFVREKVQADTKLEIKIPERLIFFVYSLYTLGIILLFFTKLL